MARLLQWLAGMQTKNGARKVSTAKAFGKARAVSTKRRELHDADLDWLADQLGRWPDAEDEQEFCEGMAEGDSVPSWAARLDK